MDQEQQKLHTEMIARANDALKKSAKEFTANLTGRVDELERALASNDRDDVLRIAYNLETEASTFGWHRVTRICKWLRKIFSGEFDQKPEPQEVLKAIEALKIMVSDPENQDEDRDIELIRELYPTLSRVVTDI